MLRMTCAALALVGLSITPAASQDASAWDTGLHAAARLIAGSIIKTDDATYLRAGVEMRLDPGWHTYWRNPGDSGVPPTFDFAGSENVKSVTVLLPAPERFPDQAGGHSIGYTRSVIFPFHVVPMDEARGSLLHLKLAYAVCEKIVRAGRCKSQLTLPGTIGTHERTLITTDSRVPRRVPLGAGESLIIRSVHRRQRGRRVVVDIAAPDGVPIDLFAEGPTPDWSLPLPELIGSNAGTPPVRIRS